MRKPLLIVIVCAAAIMALSVGFRQALGLYLTPISAELGSGRANFAMAMGLMNLFWGLGAPFAGAIADRFGSGRITALGGIAYGLGLWMMSWGGDGGQVLAGGVLIGLGLSGSGFTVILATVGRAAPPERRGQALGVASMGGSIGQFLSLPYAHALIEGTGWRMSLIFLALTCLAIVPLAYGISGRINAETTDKAMSVSSAIGEAWRSRSFWLLNTGFFVCGFHLAFVAIHLPGYVADNGFEPWLSATALTLIGVANIAGTYLCGWLGDRYAKKDVLSLLYLTRAGIFLGFLLVPVSTVSVLVFATSIGFLWLGTVPLTTSLVGVLFGTRYMAMIFGMVFLGHQFGGFLGAWLGGAVFDWLGSYDAMWIVSIALGVISALLHWPIREEPVSRQTASA